MRPALNIISLCALSLRLSLSRQGEERSRGVESLFPLSSPLSKTTGSGFLEMSAFVCCVTAAALGRSSSDEVMHVGCRRRAASGSISEPLVYPGKGYFVGERAPLQGTPRCTSEGRCADPHFNGRPPEQLVINWCLLRDESTT